MLMSSQFCIESRMYIAIYIQRYIAKVPKQREAKQIITSSNAYYVSFGKPLSFFLNYLFIFRERGRKKEREKNINVWLPLAHPQVGTWPATQACALTGNRTGNALVHRPALNPLSYTSQGLVAPFLTEESEILTQHRVTMC